MTTASTMTYDSLVQDIQNYAERPGDAVFVAQIPRIIMMAENRIASEKKPLGLQRVVSGTFAGSTMAKPERWRMTRSFSFVNALNKRVYLKNREYEFCRSYWPNASLTDDPIYYSDYDYEHFFIAPTPVAAYVFELLYFERPIPLDSTTQTNWNTQYAPQVLLYACLMDAMPFLKNSERIPEFLELYKRAMDAITGEDSDRTSDATVVRSK